MLIEDYLFNDNFEGVKIFRVLNPSDSYKEWRLDPVASELLSADDAPDDGLFIVQAISIDEDRRIDFCYMDISLPERLPDCVYLRKDDHLEQVKIWEANFEAIPAVPLDFTGDYQLYYSRYNPEVGIRILESGLKNLEFKGNLAQDLGYILRDEKRFQEAVDAFTTAIECFPNDYLLLVEKAQLLDNLGDSGQSGKLWNKVASLAGAEIVKMYRTKAS